MNKFISFRDRLRKFYTGHDKWLTRIWKALLTMASLLAINEYIGYSTYLDRIWIAVLCSILAAFIPYSGIAIILAVYMIIHLSALSLQVAVMAGLLFAATFAACRFYGAKYLHLYPFMPAFGGISFSFSIPLLVGIRGSMTDVSVVVFGGLTNFYLKMVRENASDFLDSTSEMSVLDLIQRRIVGNAMFYIYMISVIVLFMVIQILVGRAIKHAWIVASAIGIAAEEILMTGGYLFTGNSDAILPLTLGNIATFGLAVIMYYFFLNVNYDRTEEVQFEDDEYVYYVRAVPKINIATEEKEVKKIVSDATGHIDLTPMAETTEDK